MFSVLTQADNITTAQPVYRLAEQHTDNITLIIGGTGSGKSVYANSQAYRGLAQRPQQPCLFLDDWGSAQRLVTALGGVLVRGGPEHHTKRLGDWPLLVYNTPSIYGQSAWNLELLREADHHIQEYIAHQQSPLLVVDSAECLPYNATPNITDLIATWVSRAQAGEMRLLVTAQQLRTLHHPALAPVLDAAGRILLGRTGDAPRYTDYISRFRLTLDQMELLSRYCLPGNFIEVNGEYGPRWIRYELSAEEMPLCITTPATAPAN